MSKLRPYLADIASAIREKKGSSEPINAKDFSNEIRNIQSRGGKEYKTLSTQQEWVSKVFKLLLLKRV